MNKRYKPLRKSRREYFGGIIFREKPAFVAYVDEVYASSYNLPIIEEAIMHKSVFSAPLDAHFALTTSCNMHCRGCYSVTKDDKPITISLELAKRVIDKLADLGVFSVSFGGGEPTLHPDLIEIATYTREKKVLPNLTTNGLTMTKEFAKQCLVFGNVHFSIHKLADIDHVFTATKIYQKATGNKPGINLLLTTETLPRLEEILDDIRKAGLHKVLLLRYKKTNKNQEIEDLSIDDKIEELPTILKKLKIRNKSLMLMFDCSLFEVLARQGFASLDSYRKYDDNGCMGGNTYIAIDVHGRFKPCSFWPDTFGDVLKLNYKNWISNPQLNEFRNKKRSKTCNSCKYEIYCRGGCRLLV